MHNHQGRPIIVLQHFFEQQAHAFPQQTAIIYHNEKMSYETLEKKANQLANYLRNLGVKKGSHVGILLERSIFMYISMLAVIKTGAAYVPIHPDFPPERIHFIISNADVNLLITSKKYVETCGLFPCRTVLVENEMQLINQEKSEPIPFDEIKLTPEDICYIVYTSGSTGKPKGIAISHRAVCHYILAAQEVYGIKRTDRVYQGFSIAFDASVEEIWLPLSVGATIVPGLRNTLQGGIELNFLNKMKITVLSCVPTFLSMLEPNIPSLRILILGGEVCPNELLKPWYRFNLRIFNTYGPSETTVVATYSECSPNQVVTIGRPFPNCEVFILDDDLQLVKDGEIGELCITGPSLASGYIKHPELNQLKFIYHPNLGNKRLYRTGDLVKMLPNGEIQFIGRADEQVKLRGFRVELKEIENVIMQFPAIKNTVVALKELNPNDQSLVAYLILKKDVEIDYEKLNKFLRSKLPFFMVPTFYHLMNSFPTLHSGKLDRDHLPVPQEIMRQARINYVAPRTKIEKSIIHTLEELFKRKPISIKDDFFYDLFGHSLLAARFISELRKNKNYYFVSIRDLYENPTVEKLAKCIEKNQGSCSTNKKHILPGKKNQSKIKYYLCGLGQVLGCYLEFACFAWQFLAIYLLITFMLTTSSFFSMKFLFTFSLFLLLLHPILFAFVILLKWLLLGRVRAGHYPLWGWFYFRWWFVRQMIHCLLPIRILVGSPLMNWYCRLMGARIGANCCIQTYFVDSFDLLSIGEYSAIGIEASLLGYEVENDFLIIGPITIGDHCYVGNNCVLNANTIMHSNAKLEDQSMLPAGTIIPKGAYFEGSPAIFSQSQREELKPSRIKKVNYFDEGMYGVVHYLFALILYFRFVLAITPGVILADAFNDSYGLASALAITLVSAIIFILLYCLVTVLFKLFIIKKFQAGRYPIYSLTYVRKWLFDRLMASSIETIGSIYATLYVIPWLRLLGAKIGKYVEVSTPHYIAPDLLHLNDESFIADYAQLGVPYIDNGYITFHPTEIGKRAFIGNSAVIPAGTKVGDSCLIACFSIPPKHTMRKNTSWGGSPAMLLPKREKFQTFSLQETYRPSLILYLQRLGIDFLRVILPSTFLFMTILLEIVILERLQLSHIKILAIALLFPIIYAGIMLCFSGIVIALKWILMGRYQPGTKPAWSLFVFKNELITGLYDFYLDDLLSFLVGTPFLSYVLNLLGAKIGKQVFLDTTNFTEFDLINIEDHAEINKDATLQPHLFEDKIFKMGHVTMKSHTMLGVKSVILYDAIQEKHSTLGSLSLLMKGEILPPNSYWHGVPAQPKKNSA